MAGPGPNREHEGEIEFSSDELVEMNVDVAGREEAQANRRKKRALRVPADEVPRTATPALSTEPDLEAIVPDAADAGDELVEHAFSNGGRAEGEVRAAGSFVAAEPVDAAASGPSLDDLEPEISIDGEAPTKPSSGSKAPIPANLRALMRALAPASRKLESQEVEQLDSDELEVVETRAVPPAVPLPMPPVVSSVGAPAQTIVELEAEPIADVAAEDVTEDDAEEVPAVELTEDDDQPRARRPTLPPATPAAAALAPRARSITPVMAPQTGPTIPLATAPMSPPPAPLADGEVGLRPRRRRRAKQWFEEIFDDDYLRTLPYLSPRQTERETSFILESLEAQPGAALLDLACGYGRHAMELAGRGYKVTGLDLSLPLLIRAADAARRLGVAVNFVHGDMREMTFEAEFDAAYCMFTSFGYFDDDTNRKVAANLQRALRPGGRVLIEVANRDYITRDLPTRVWWQGEGCVVLEEVDFNYFSSRLQTQRSIILEDGRQLEQEISIRAYSLHEIGKVLHHAGFRVIEVSGGLGLRGKFFGAQSRQLLVLAEKKPTP